MTMMMMRDDDDKDIQFVLCVSKKLDRVQPFKVNAVLKEKKNNIPLEIDTVSAVTAYHV